MKYAEYKESAIRHLQTCKYMTKYLNYVFTPKEKFRILCNIYYLGGYVIEGILCYTIFYLIKYDLNKSVYDLKDFNKEFDRNKLANFNSVWARNQDFYGNIILVSVLSAV